MSPFEFWELTLAEFVKIAEGYVRRQKQKYNELIYVAWHTEAFARMKKLPSLKSLIREDKERHEQTDEEMMAMAKMLNAAFGGEEIEY